MMRAYLLVFSLLCSSNLFAATYDVTFNGIWNASQVDSGTYPGNAHFTTVIGTTHTQGSAFWQRGGSASEGVERVAELGATNLLVPEIAAARQAGTAGNTFTFDDQFDLPQSETIRIEVDDDKAFLTLITMIAPSPDWFVGVSGLALKENGQWLESITAQMHPYDAGTEEGDSFSLLNSATSPRGRITLVSGEDSPFIGSPIVATVELRLIAQPPQVISPPAEPRTAAQTSSIANIINLLLQE